VGLPAEEVAKLVSVGDVISFAVSPADLSNGMLVSPYLDNRAAVAAITLCLEELQSRRHVWDVAAVATVQEEWSLGGARTSAYALRPAVAVAVDVTHGASAAAKEYSHRSFNVGGGPVLGLGPNIHPGLHAAFKAAAEKLEMACGTEAMAGFSGTDAHAMQVVRAGIPTMVLSIPLRHMHTPVELLSIKDVTRAGRLLAEFVASLGMDFIDKLKLD